MITCRSGVTIRTAIASIREAGRATQGVKLIKLDEGDEIAAITNLDDSVIEEETDVIETNSEVKGGNDLTVSDVDRQDEETQGEADEDDSDEDETSNDTDNDIDNQ